MRRFLKQIPAILFIVTALFFLVNNQVMAADARVLGIHILNTQEISKAQALLAKEDQESWRYITIPLTLEDLEKREQWQDFFKQSKDAKLIPIVRLTTHFEDNSWKIPNRKEITDQIAFLSNLDWPTDEKYIIVLNEVNHAAEFGNQLEPATYARLLEFTTNWAHSEAKNYKVLPAAMDLAASNTANTMEAFTYLEKMLIANPQVFELIDYWNSHSYPNPGFVASPTKSDKQSLRGFEHELTFVKNKIGRDMQVFITETGWRDTYATSRWLDSYYEYAMQHIWSDDKVKAVTPFILQGAPGPFSSFSFLDAAGEPTKQYYAYRRIIENY